MTSVAYWLVPPTYEATSEFSLEYHDRKSLHDHESGLIPKGWGGYYESIYSTRHPIWWRSDVILPKILHQYRLGNPGSKLADSEILFALKQSSLELLRTSRVFSVSVRLKSPQFAAALANAYVEAIKVHTGEENRGRGDHVLAEITNRVARQRQNDFHISQQLRKFRAEHDGDGMAAPRSKSEREAIAATIRQLEHESEVSKAILKDLLEREHEIRQYAEGENEVISVLRKAEPPSKPITPNPVVFFSIGLAISLASATIYRIVSRTIPCNNFVTNVIFL